jgi:adenine/guanine phosphoribosyltransferase-like PRPP-binding protein
VKTYSETSRLASESHNASNGLGASVAGDGDSPLVVHNLLNDMAALGRLLAVAARRGPSLDAYLLAAAMGQIVDDHRPGEIRSLTLAADYLLGQKTASGRTVGRAVAMVASAGRRAVALGPATGRTARWRRDLAKLVDGLADAAAGRSPTGAEHSALLEAIGRLAGDLGELGGGLHRELALLPTCFHDLDQHPSDLARLAGEFAERWPDRRTPLLIVGVRTSGSYLAPLSAAFLRGHGYTHTRVLTVRPGRGLRKQERDLIRSVTRAGGLVLVMDDPPVTGGSIATAARELERAGASGESIVLLLQVIGTDAALPSALDRYHALVLPSPDWTLRARLTPVSVKRSLSKLLSPNQTLVAVAPLPLPARQPARGHMRALFRVRLHDANSGEEAEKEVLVEGVGLGYLGRQELAAARALGGFTPTVFGLRDGLVYREWLPEERRVSSVDHGEEESLAAEIAKYVAERHRAFPVAEDVSLRLDDAPAWEVASSIISKAFGRAWPLARVLLTDRAVRRILRVEHPSVVDGNTDLAHWFYRDDSRRSLVKVDVGDQLFSNLGLRCCDAAFDLAGVTARAGTPSFARRLRSAYADLTQEQIGEERWLLYELAHLWGRERTQPEREPELRRSRSRAVQRYFAELYLRDIAEATATGPLCALDIDGVLETEHLGFSAPTPASALALRALRLHGFRPVLVSGRSLGEVVDRCGTYGLPGAVAEYGAAIYDGRTGEGSELVPSEGVRALDELRGTLRRAGGVHLDEDHRHAVRAFRIERGQRLGLRPETIASALAVHDRIRAVEGEGQTDFIAGVDKGTGLRALTARLGGAGTDPGDRIALAVGDTVADLPLAGLASRACAPAHAHALRRSGTFDVMTRPYQAGLAQAVGELIGHAPGRCRVCRMPRLGPERRILLTALAARERGVQGLPLQALKLAFRLT